MTALTAMDKLLFWLGIGADWPPLSGASQSFDDSKVVVMVIVVAIVGLIVLMPLSRALSKRGFAQQN
jgi:hypothetical protein